MSASSKPLPDFTISKLRATIGAVARPNLWEAELYIPQGSLLKTKPESFKFRCEKAEIPGRTIATVDDTGSGPTLKLPYDVTYNDIEITIICSTDMIEREYFENWIDTIINPSSEAKKGGLLNYYSQYARGNELNLRQVDEVGETLLTYYLRDVYPIQISPMNLSWEETNTYQRFNVTMTYRYYEYTKS